jgi:hypothetical protein
MLSTCYRPFVIGKHLPWEFGLGKLFLFFAQGKGVGLPRFRQKREALRACAGREQQTLTAKHAKDSAKGAEKIQVGWVRVGAGENLQSKIINLKFFRLDVP